MGKKSREKRERRETKKTGKGKSIEKYFNKPDLNGARTSLEIVCLFIIRWAVYLMLLTPLVVSGRFFFPFVGPKGLYLMAFIEIAFFSWLVLAFCFPQYRPKKNVLLLCLGAFLIILTLATIFGADPSRSFWSKFERMSGLLMWFHFFGLFLALTNVFKDKRIWMRFFAVSVGITVLTCFLFFIDKLGAKGLSVARNGSTLGNSSFFATYLLFNLYFAIYLFFNSWRNRKERIFNLSLLLPAIILMIIALIMSHGTAATIAFFGGLGLIWILWLAFEIKKKNLRTIGRIVLIFSTIIFLTSIVLLYVPDSIVQQKLIEVKNRARPLLWQMGWKGFSERPILGWGPQNFTFIFNQNFHPCFYLGECGGVIRFDQAHNIVIDNLADAGILGLLGYLSIFFSCFWILWKAYFKKRISFWAASVPSALLVAHFTQNLTVFDMPASFLMLFLTFGLISISTEPEEQAPTKISVSNSRIAFTTFIILILFFFCFSNFIIKPAKIGSGLIKVAMAGNMEEKTLAYKQALYSSPMGIYQARTYLTLDLVNNSQKGKDIPQEEFDLMAQELEKSIKSSPLDYYSCLVLGKLYNLYTVIFEENKVIRAEEVLEIALKLSPTKQNVYWELSKSKAMLGKNEEGIILAEKAVELEPRVAYSQFHLVNLIKITGNHDLAVQKAKEAIEILPEIELQLKTLLGIEEF
jgi:O-antigen ligase